MRQEREPGRSSGAEGARDSAAAGTIEVGWRAAALAVPLIVPHWGHGGDGDQAVRTPAVVRVGVDDDSRAGHDATKSRIAAYTPGRSRVVSQRSRHRRPHRRRPRAGQRYPRSEASREEEGRRRTRAFPGRKEAIESRSSKGSRRGYARNEIEDAAPRSCQRRTMARRRTRSAGIVSRRGGREGGHAKAGLGTRERLALRAANNRAFGVEDEACFKYVEPAGRAGGGAASSTRQQMPSSCMRRAA